MRLHYVYPYPHVDEVIPLMADGKVLPYLDIPFQHASPAVLKRMRRPAAQEKTLERIQRWREICPDLTIRSTFIVGFPGETDEEFQLLLDWLDEAQLDRVGCFRYEPVDGAAANDLAAPVPADVKEERWHRFMAAAAGDLGAAAQAQGRHPPAGHHRRGRPTVAKGRSKGDAPEIDGAVYVASLSELLSIRSTPSRSCFARFHRALEVFVDAGLEIHRKVDRSGSPALRKAQEPIGVRFSELLRATARGRAPSGCARRDFVEKMFVVWLDHHLHPPAHSSS